MGHSNTATNDRGTRPAARPSRLESGGVDLGDEILDRYVEEKKKSSLIHRPTAAKDFTTELARLATVATVEPGSRVLDVGCGLGGWAYLLAEAGYEAHGLDFSPGLVAEATARAAESGVNATFTVGAAEDMPYADGTFDVVVCNYMLEHAGDWRAVVREIGRVLRPGGLAFLSTVCVFYPFTDEVRLPLYPYYPPFAKRRAIKLALTRYPGLVRYSPTPAINWLAPWTLKRAFREAGFVEIKDAFDVVRADQVRGVKGALAKGLLPVLRRFPPLRALAYFGYPALKIYAVRGAAERGR